MPRRRIGVSGYTDSRGRTVPNYSQRRQTGRSSWTGSPSRPKPRNAGPKLAKDGSARNVAQTFTVSQFRRKQAAERKRANWKAREDRDRTPGRMAISGVITGASGVIITATATGLLVILGVFVAVLGAVFGVLALGMRAGWFDGGGKQT